MLGSLTVWEVFVCFLFCFSSQTNISLRCCVVLYLFFLLFLFPFFAVAVYQLFIPSGERAVGQWQRVDFSFSNWASSWSWHSFKWDQMNMEVLSNLKYSVRPSVLCIYQSRTKLLFFGLSGLFGIYTWKRIVSTFISALLDLNLPVLGRMQQ